MVGNLLLWRATLVLLAALGPGQAPARAPTSAQDTDVAAAKRLYTIGEQHMAAGRADEAVALWRKVVRALPETADYDALRHKLVLRLVYGLLVAHEQTGRRAYLVEANETIARHLRWHETRFGETEAAKAARSDVYAQLVEVEARLEGSTAAAEPEPEPEPEPTPSRDRAGHEDGEVREVIVHTRKKAPSVDDPETVARLKSPTSDANAGLVLTAPGMQPLTPARGLVRLAGPPRPTRVVSGRRIRKASRTRARTVLASARPRLRRCFESAFARTPTDVVQTELELTIDRDGTVREIEIVGPEVIDATGSDCVREELSIARAAPDEVRRAVRVRMSVVFFWEDAKFIDEANGCTGTPWHVAHCGRARALNHGSEGGMPPIDAPVRGR